MTVKWPVPLEYPKWITDHPDDPTEHPGSRAESADHEDAIRETWRLRAQLSEAQEENTRLREQRDAALLKLVESAEIHGATEAIRSLAKE